MGQNGILNVLLDTQGLFVSLVQLALINMDIHMEDA
jgi:hypothetical protein